MATNIELGFAPVRSRRLLDAVVATLEAPILDGRLKEGDLLPSEEQLANQLGVGRRAVREALKVLETKGLVEVQMGVGSIVRRNDLDTFLNTLSRNVSAYLHANQAQAKHVMALRLLLEGAGLEHIATTRDQERLDRLAANVHQQQECLRLGDFRRYQEWHFQFHHEIIDSLDNPILSMLYRQVMALMRTPMERAGALPSRTARTIAEHGQLVAAARAGDLGEVRRILRHHLEQFFENVGEDENQD